MAEPKAEQTQEAQPTTLEGGAYDIIQQRLLDQGQVLRERMEKLDARRREVFGSVELELKKSDSISTSHNCVSRDMIQLGQGRFLFGFNVRFGLKKEYALEDVFALYEYDAEAQVFREGGLEVLKDSGFEEAFKRLYKIYNKSVFAKFSLVGPELFMAFRTGDRVDDLLVFKWEYNDGSLRYMSDRADNEYKERVFPKAYNFTWRHPSRDDFRYGEHPHVSIEDMVFVECVGGDLTIKVEDNTSSGGGILAEAVENQHQKLDDAEYLYAVQGSLVLLKILPYQEKDWRYFIYNAKMEEVHRVDSVGQACVMLPEEHGVIFPDGYYLQTGELKRFETEEGEMVLERIVTSPNGEDTLYVFYNRMSGLYALMPYRLIQQEVPERISASGFSLFADGQMISFKAGEEAQKQHMVQLHQTPFFIPGHEPETGNRDDFLFQVQNKPVVRCLSECHEILTLILKENPYADLYADMASRAQAIPDSYSWLKSEAGGGIVPALADIRESADKAIAEFDKVRRLKREALEHVEQAQEGATRLFSQVNRTSFNKVDDFVANLGGLRTLRGELISLKEIRYVDVAAIEALEAKVVEQSNKLSERCVHFLLAPEAMDPYRARAEEQQGLVSGVTKATEAKELEEEVLQASEDLEMLIKIVNSLKIADTTEQTRIIEGITAIFTTVNQTKEALKKKAKSLMAVEGAAQFDAQMKLLSQSAVNALDMSDTPEKCDEYYNGVVVQLEDLEGAFADFDEYIEQLTDKRLELEEAFEQKRLQLVELRNRKAATLVTSAERMLKSVQHKLGTFEDLNEINGYMASDLVIEKIRNVIGQLSELDKAGEAEGLQSKMKSQHEEAVRQLKDKQELFVDGQNIIQFGQHKFAVNVQPLDLTIIRREDDQCLHLTGTQYFEPIKDEAFLATREVWSQEVISENREIYRAEYLAYLLWKKIVSGDGPGLDEVLAMEEAQRLDMVQKFMADRYSEAYTKGIHDEDGEKILHALLTTHSALQLARYHPRARACAAVYWHKFCNEETQALWAAKLDGFAKRNELFPGDPVQREYIGSLTELVRGFVAETGLFDEADVIDAGEYLFYEVVAGKEFAISQEADKLLVEFERHLDKKGSGKLFKAAQKKLQANPGSQFQLVSDWARGFLLTRNGENKYLDEVAALVFCNLHEKQAVVKEATGRVVEGMQGAHRAVEESSYPFDYLQFQERLGEFERESVPRFEAYQQMKQNLIEREHVAMRLNEFVPRVLTSFVRSQLIDKVYLPLVGDNLAKQIGSTGEGKRTDLMGLLLLVSPPGYGKTTLMEYLANRLGLIFMKINGPALGHDVTSLDPEDAPNAGAREEVNKLNLSLEMGDNVMIYLDDIQHCNPEFLQKFISLCDAQRKIEGVWRGRPQTYDLRGRRVVVVMAGNPYTESGEKFRIPDMLANRADTYNLGDMSRENEAAFNGSYLENAITSNPVLKPLSSKSQKDIQGFIRIAETGIREGVEFEGNYSAQESEEIVLVLKKMITVRDVVLKVNQMYIESAGQAEEFRTEPAFRMQGSYRNMNRMAEKILAIMNDAEVQDLILGHYEGESQTLTTGTEANMLKFKELIGVLEGEELERWEEIKETYGRNQFLQGADSSDPVSRVVSQLSLFEGGLNTINKTISDAVNNPRPMTVDLGPVGESLDALRETVADHLSREAATGEGETAAAPAEFSGINDNLIALRTAVESYLTHATQSADDGNQELKALADYLGEGLSALRSDIADSMAQIQGSVEAERVERVSLQMNSIQDTMAGLRDVLARNREGLKSLQARAEQAAPEMVLDINKELINDTEALFEAIMQQIAQIQQQDAEPPPKDPPPAS